jgi:hypothetical protein
MNDDYTEEPHEVSVNIRVIQEASEGWLALVRVALMQKKSVELPLSNHLTIPAIA